MTRPAVVKWYRIFAYAIVLSTVALTLWLFIAGLPALENDAWLQTLGNFAWLPIGLMLLSIGFFISLYVMTLIKRPSPFTYKITGGLLTFTTLSCVAAPFSIPLLIYWLKPENKRYYGMLGGGPVVDAAADGFDFSLFRFSLDENPSAFVRFLEYYYPFTFSGTLLAIMVIMLLGYAFGGNNLYALALGVLGAGTIFLFILLGRIQALRMHDPDIVWHPASALVSRYGNAGLSIFIGENKTFYFFRMHFRVNGRLRAGRQADMSVYAEGASSNSGEIFLPMYFPVCGKLDLLGRLSVRDVFGFTRVRIAPVDKRRLEVLPPVFAGKQDIQFKNSATLKSTRRMFHSDEEKYYMREYIPGDRLKDINWKASFKFNELITRISPQAPDISRLLHIEFRNFHNDAEDSPEAIIHLNYLKSWLLSFLWQTEKSHPDYRYQIYTADEVFMLEDKADIDAFARHLSGLHFRKGFSFNHAISPAQEKFIFTTAFDPGGAYAAAGQRNTTCYIFRTARGKGKQARHVRLLPLDHGPNPWPGLWALHKTKKTGPRPVLQSGRMLEEKLKVSIF